MRSEVMGTARKTRLLGPRRGFVRDAREVSIRTKPPLRIAAVVPSLVFPAIALAFLALLPEPARADGGGVIMGQIFTAEDPDSVAAGASLTLLFRDPSGALQRLPATAGPMGGFLFQGLSTDPSLAYVVRVEYRGNEFLGSPVQFPEGQTTLEFNVLISTDKPLDPSMFEGEMPPGHPQIPGAGPAVGRPVRPDPILTFLVTAGILLLLATPVWLLARRDRRRVRLGFLAPARPLLLEIALLDERFTGGAVSNEDYRRTRAELLGQVRTATAAAGAEPETARPRPALGSLTPERADHAG